MLFLSIHPQYVRAILAGKKRVELRKRVPNVVPGATIAIYATTPECAVVATAVIEEIKAGTPSDIWRYANRECAVSKEDFDTYFFSSPKAVAIRFSDVQQFKNPISLEALREIWGAFQPPQQYKYLSPRQCELIDSRRTLSV